MRVKALHDYVADRVSYDVESYRAGTYPPQDAETVFRTRRSVCAGYANLLAAMGQASGDEIVVVGGDARTNGRDLTGEGHAWNAARIGGRWTLLDPTWDAGFLKEDRFVKRYSTEFLFTPPEVQGLSHFPEEERWQLRHPPLSRGEFLRQPLMRPLFYAEGFTLVSPDRPQVTVDAVLEASIRNPRHRYVLAHYERRDGEPCARTARSSRDRSVSVRCELPDEGTYRVVLFSNRTQVRHVPAGRGDRSPEGQMMRDSARSLWWNRGPRMKAKPARARRLTAVALGCVAQPRPRPWPAIPSRTGDWRSYGGDPGGSRFSPLADIDRGNVGRLQRAWTYHTGDLETRPAAQPTAFETHAAGRGRRRSTSRRRPAASSPSTATPAASSGRFDPPPRATRRTRRARRRIAASRTGKSRRRPRPPHPLRHGRRPADRPRRAHGAACARISATAGMVDLRAGVADALAARRRSAVTSPPAIYRDLVITGTLLAGVPGPRARGRRPRLRRADGRARLALPHRAAARRAGARHLGGRRAGRTARA